MENNLNYLAKFLQKENMNSDIVFSTTGFLSFPTPYFKSHIKELFKIAELKEFLNGYVLDKNQFFMAIENRDSIITLVIYWREKDGEEKYESTVQIMDGLYWLDIHKGEDNKTFQVDSKEEVFAFLALEFFNQ